MAVPTVVQTPTVVVASAVSSVNLTMGSAVTAGNALVGCVLQTGSATRSWTVTDTVDAGNWANDIEFNPGRAVTISHRFNASAGTPTITWTVNTSTWTGYAWACEVAGLDSGGTIQTGSISEGVASDNHTCNATNLTGSDVFVMAAGVLTAAATSSAAGSGYTAAPSGTGTNKLIEYQVTASLNDNGPWTSTGTDRLGVSAMAVYPAPVVAGGGHPTMRRWGGIPGMANSGAGYRGSRTW
jgi:hypothetical protein